MKLISFHFSNFMRAILEVQNESDFSCQDSLSSQNCEKKSVCKLIKDKTKEFCCHCMKRKSQSRRFQIQIGLSVEGEGRGKGGKVVRLKPCWIKSYLRLSPPPSSTLHLRIFNIEYQRCVFTVNTYSCGKIVVYYEQWTSM